VEHSEYIVGGWPWQILGEICTVATAGEPGEILFCFSPGKQRTISLIFRQPTFTKFEHNTSISVAMKPFPFLPLESIRSHSPDLYPRYKKPPQIFRDVRRGLTTRPITLISLDRRPANPHRILSHVTLGLVECNK